MISIEDLRGIAKLKGLKNIGYAEKDYILDIILLSISRNTKDELVFKGGTCLSKFYKLDRFSEDVDFTAQKEIDIDSLLEKIISDLKSFGMEAEIKNKKKAFNSIMTTIRAKGILYRGSPTTLASVGIDVNFKSTIYMEPVIAEYISLYPDIPKFSLLIMSEKEIFSEKIRAIMERRKARDVYDLWFLLTKKNIKFDFKIINKKLEYYNQKWDVDKFLSAVKDKKEIWEDELKHLLTGVPDFDKVLADIKEAVKA